MARDPIWLRKLAEAYFDASKHADLPLDDDDPRDQNCNRADAVVSQVLGLLPDEPEDCWRFIQIACELKPSVEQLGLLGAGIFEDLMDEFGEQFIDRIEVLAAVNPALQTVVDGAWTMSMPLQIAERIEAIQTGPVAADNRVRRDWWLAQKDRKV